ncbi:MAG TPA: CapA family protein [Acidimicrobiales bacterium]|nr:CapA family protein [Acidimicrobiales bacterium]
MVRIAFAGDTMLGRGVAERLEEDPKAALVAPEVLAVAAEADMTILNLECCISERGERWPDPAKPFFFRAPPAAVDTLSALGARCVTLANNHALDYGTVALVDTFAHLEAAGIAWVGAGLDLTAARAPALLDVAGERIAVVGFTDHPAEYAARADRPGVAHAELHAGVPGWLTSLVGAGPPPVIVLVHWGPNMTARPEPYVRAAAATLEQAGATLVAGHSAHVFHGLAGRVLYDLGDFVDDYWTDPLLRNDLGLLWLVTLDADGPRRLEAVPLTLEYCHTRLAVGDDARWVRSRLHAACRELGTDVVDDQDRLVFDW